LPCRAGQRIRSWDPERRSRFIENLMMWFSEEKCTPEVRKIWIGYWTECDAALGKELRSMCEEKSLLTSEE
jgi:catalase